MQSGSDPIVRRTWAVAHHVHATRVGRKPRWRRADRRGRHSEVQRATDRELRFDRPLWPHNLPNGAPPRQHKN